MACFVSGRRLNSGSLVGLRCGFFRDCELGHGIEIWRKLGFLLESIHLVFELILAIK